LRVILFVSGIITSVLFSVTMPTITILLLLVASASTIALSLPGEFLTHATGNVKGTYQL